MIAWQEPLPIRTDTPQHEIAWAAISSGGCAKIGFGVSDEALDRRFVTYLDQAKSEGMTEEQAIEPIALEGVRAEAWFSSLLARVPISADWSDPEVTGVIRDVSRFCLSAAAHWPDVVLNPDGLPTTEGGLIQHIRTVWAGSPSPDPESTGN